jgi:hypothetical protein
MLGVPAHRQFAEAAGTGSANRQVGMLQQAGDVVAEATFHQPGVLEFTHVGIVAPREMHHPTALAPTAREVRPAPSG